MVVSEGEGSLSQKNGVVGDLPRFGSSEPAREALANPNPC
ncbi:hypothetical protein COLO4_35551 [Corchorus olitorius]|uniref:Uncharacterized protein n=1 Tax=Corchorus olitorius TaxID=93759 RepID=A0A1R3GFF1_9ROSI|nr:hypothetical protein COLO4_35551 [Corchorus olitorius]